MLCNGSTNALGAFSLGSNPSTPTLRRHCSSVQAIIGLIVYTERTTVREVQVSYIGITLAFQANERGSTPLTCSKKKQALCLSFFFDLGRRTKEGVGSGSLAFAKAKP